MELQLDIVMTEGTGTRFHSYASFYQFLCIYEILNLNLYCRYALGGFDGSAMVPSIEVYDPRLGSWMSGEPLKHSRGYLGAAVVKEAIYVIGGVKSGSDIVDTVSYLLPRFFPSVKFRGIDLTHRLYDNRWNVLRRAKAGKKLTQE